MTRNKPLQWIALLALLIAHQQAVAYPGLTTRDQNPLLQAYYIPTIFDTDQPGWSHSHNLFITNTFQDESRSGEKLTIDSESLRYDFNLAYQQQDWLFTLQLPYVNHSAGQLDGLIEDWHGFFQLPEGGRDNNPDNQLNIDYQRDGKSIASHQQSSTGLGDIKLALAYQLNREEKHNTRLWLGLDLPSAESDSSLGNDGLDFASWISHQNALNHRLRVFGMTGVSLIDDSGPLAGQLNSVIGFAQAGLNYQFTHRYALLLQVDLHSAVVKDTRLKALGNSMQMQFGLALKDVIPKYDLTLFFSEDILVGTAPDITFGLELKSSLDW